MKDKIRAFFWDTNKQQLTINGVMLGLGFALALPEILRALGI